MTHAGFSSPDSELDREIAEALDDISLDALLSEPTPRPSAAAHSGKVTGRILRVAGTDVFVDLHGKSEGFLTLDEFPPDKPPVEGHEWTFYSKGRDPDSNLLRLSLSEALLDASWDSLQVGSVVEGRVTGVNKGGLEVAVGAIRGFMPMGQVDLVRIEDFTPFINQRIECEVIEVERSDRRLLLSRRKVLERQRAAAREELKYTLQVGQTRQGVVRRIMDFGAFVDIGGADGLLHISDMSYGRLKHPSEMLKVGDTVAVTVLKIDLVTDKISLGLKQLRTDPWSLVEANYRPGSTVTGRVTKLMDFGAFVELEPGVEGLIPMGEMSYTKRIAHPRELLKEGDAVQIQIVSIESEKRRISLSLKRLGADPWSSAAERYKPEEIVSGLVTRTADFGAFIQLEEGLEGLAHISELSHKRVTRVTDVAKPGMVVQARILSVDAVQRRISLSLKMPQVAPVDSALPSDSASDANTTPVSPTQLPKPRKRPLRGGLD